MNNLKLWPSFLKNIYEKILNKERLTIEDGIQLYNSPHTMLIAHLADQFNATLNQKYVYFIQNLYINPTNVCEASCSFCRFRRDAEDETAYTMDEETLLSYVEKRYYNGIMEFHIVGGHNHKVDFNYYLNTLKILKNKYPHVTLKAYTAAEIVFFSKQTGMSFEKVLKELISVGLNTLPGGGAEILTERYRKIMSPDKANTQEWLEVHSIAHNLGLKTHATMLYGGIETYEERLIHMIHIRELQDQTNGFLAFIPLAMQPHSKKASITRRTTAMDDLKTIAISRLMVDNVKHIKAYFINIGLQLTQLATQAGASDIHGTMVEERISHAAGAISENSITKKNLIWLIKKADRIPVERDTFYNKIQEH